MLHKEIFDIISQNALNLNDYDDIIDKDVENELNNFIPERNNTLRNKVLNYNSSHIPNREERFTELFNEYINSKDVENQRKYFHDVYQGKFSFSLKFRENDTDK